MKFRPVELLAEIYWPIQTTTEGPGQVFDCESDCEAEIQATLVLSRRFNDLSSQFDGWWAIRCRAAQADASAAIRASASATTVFASAFATSACSAASARLAGQTVCT